MSARAPRVPHGLSTPPPTKAEVTAPREGILACVDGCPYRRAYGCQDEERDVGRSVGWCVLEAARGNELLRDATRDERWLPEGERGGLVLAARRWMAAMLYAHRCLVWLGRLTGEPDGPDTANQVRVAQRYFEAGDHARQKLWGELRPLLERARLLKVTCGPWRAHVAARRIGLDGGNQMLPGLRSVKNHALVLVDLRLSNPTLGVYFDELRAERSVKEIRLTRRRPWGSDALDPVQAFRIRRLLRDSHPGEPSVARTEARRLLAKAGINDRPDRVIRRVMDATERMIHDVEAVIRGIKVIAPVWSPQSLVTGRSRLSPD